LGTAKSRIVALIDSLEAAGLATRSRSARDRRNQELRLTGDGRDMLRRLRSVAEAQEEEVAEGLSDAERAELYGLLRRLSEMRGLAADVHPGYAARTASQDDA